MTKGGDYVPAMGSFPPKQQQPDEGYSEAPLNSSVPEDISTILSTLRSPTDLPAWLAANPSILPESLKKDLTLCLLDGLPTSIISDIAKRLYPRLHIDFIPVLPAEICLKILGYLDPVSLIRVAQTCRTWYELALDRKLWERLYHLEGWQVLWPEIRAWEERVNSQSSSGHIHRIQTGDGQTSKVRALSGDPDNDCEMTDSDRIVSAATDASSGPSIFGSPSSSFSSNRRGITPLGEVNLDSHSNSRHSERSPAASSSTDTRGKRKEPGGDVVTSLQPILPAQDPRRLTKSSLWMWDVNQSRHRLNWKYLYNLRWRLENNWEMGKYTTFQLPHPSYPEEGHNECVYTIQFDANWLVSGSRDQTVRIWNMHTRRLARAPLEGHSGSVLCLQFDADPEEDILVTGSSDSNVFVWKFSTGELLQKLTKAHSESVLNVRFDKRILVTSSKDNSIKIFNRRALRYGDLGYGKSDPLYIPTAAMSRPGYEPDLAHELPVKLPFTQIGRLDGHNAAVNAVQVKDRTVVSVSGDRQIKVWDWPDQICTKTIPAHQKGIACVEFDGRRIVSGSSDYDVFIFDALKGCPVAQLCGHAHLVRTVQAGFADLPYSEYEDPLEAKRVEARASEYRRAHGLEDLAPAPRSRRTRRVNAGSSRPQDVQTVGSLLPPGGGGSKRYGRIVSGSYDQQVIVWRRNKEGEWKPAWHLRQEEAAAAARAQAAAAPRESLTATQRGLPSQLAGQHLAGVPRPPPHPRDFRNLIAQAIPQGAQVLRATLVTHPGMLYYHDRIQAAIDREQSPFIRAQLRNAVTDAILVISNDQAAQVAAVSAPAQHAASSSSSQSAQAGSSTSTAGGAAGNASVSTPYHAGAAPPSVASNTQNTTSERAPPAAPTPAPAQLPPTTTPAQQAAVITAAERLAAARHPHLPVDQGPARIFKLQFDARKIVCCSQAQVIVGWDFCNGDLELEEASRFFAPIE